MRPPDESSNAQPQVALSVPGASPEHQGASGNGAGEFKFKIVHFNDMHGHVQASNASHYPCSDGASGLYMGDVRGGGDPAC